MFSQRMTSASDSTFSICGGSASSGIRPSTRLTASRTSLAAASMSRDSENSIVTDATPLRLRDSTVSMPSMPATASSSTCVIRVSTTAADAPGYATCTDTIGGSMFGSSRSVSRVNAMMPTTTSSRLITVAKTGRRIDRSERLIASARRGRRRGVGRLRPAGLRRLRRDLGDPRAVAQLHRTVDDDAFAGGETLQDLDFAGAARTEFDAALLDGAVGLHDEDVGLLRDLHDRDLRDRQRRS